MVHEDVHRGVTNGALENKLERKLLGRGGRLYNLMESYARVDDTRILKEEEGHRRSSTCHRDGDRLEARKSHRCEVCHIK